MIIGKPGSGKTFFAHRLGKETGREVIHLDKHYWKVGWIRAFDSSEKFKDKVQELISGDEWILDGNFKNSIDIRLELADTVVFFDFPVWKSLVGVYKRWLFGGNNPVDLHPDMRERVSFELLKMILFYPTKSILQKLKNFDGKKIFIVKSRTDAEKAFHEIAGMKNMNT